MRLSDKCLKNAKPTTKSFKLFDGGGLYLEVMPHGGKLWRLKFRYAGKEKRLSMGTYPLISLKEAREKRDEAKKLLDKNIDPSVAKQETKRKAVSDTTNTFELIAREWHKNVKHKWTQRNGETILKRMEAHVFPRIGNLPIRSIKPSMLLNALKEIENGGVFETTKRINQYVGQIFRYAVVTDRADKDISIGISGWLKQSKVKHFNALDADEIPDFLARLSKNDARLFAQTRFGVELMLLTFVRTSELLNACWSEIDFDNKMWTIPAERMKMRKVHFVPLSEQVVTILTNLKSLGIQSKYILPSPFASRKPMSNNTILFALYRMGYKGRATGHGFRALAMTCIKEKLGYRHEVVDRQLAHAHRNSVDAAYDRAQFLDERKKMMQEWADYIDSLRLKLNNN